MQAPDLQRFAELALACVHREYPNQIAHRMEGDGDARPPRELTPCFYGCYDWHSAVHGHWLLARLCRLNPDAPYAGRCRAALAESLSAEKVAGEVLYLSQRPAFERPYGLAWLLALHGELAAMARTDTEAHQWMGTLTPLAQLAAGRFQTWLPKLSHPVRTGVHSQSAFGLGLALDWADARGEEELAALIRRRATDHHGDDRDYPLHLEPSGEDFLSPSLGAADLVRRVLSGAEFAAWLARALPGLPEDGRDDWLSPAVVTDPTDGRLAHLDGLNLSRAWMLHAIADALPGGDARIDALRGAAARHQEAGLAAVTDTHYEGAHWLGTFAVYLLSRVPVTGADVR